MKPRPTSRARALRRNATDAERRLWYHLRDRRMAGCKFRRQVPIGPFIADFCCTQLQIVIEVDGGQHMEQQAADASRTRYLESRGYRVLRFWNSEVIQQLEPVLERIRRAVTDNRP